VIDGLNGFFRKIGRGLKKFTKNIGRKVIKPVVSTFNRFLNPATILLRNGFLLAMKADLMKVASRLRYGYLTDAQAKRMNIDKAKFQKLKKAVSKAEKIYRLAGGRGRNLRKAILKGKGNKDRRVPLSGFGLGMVDEDPIVFNDPFEKFIVESDLDTFEAFLNNEVNGLGAVATAPAMAAASGAVASVSVILDKIGNIFGQAQKVKQQAQTLFQKPRRPLPVSPFTSFTPGVSSQNRMVSNQSFDTMEAKKPWIERNKTPLLIGAVGLVAAGGVVMAIKSNKKKTSRSISGIPKRQKTKGRDALGRFTKGHGIIRKKRKKRKTPEKLVAKAIV